MRHRINLAMQRVKPAPELAGSPGEPAGRPGGAPPLRPSTTYFREVVESQAVEYIHEFAFLYDLYDFYDHFPYRPTF